MYPKKSSVCGDEDDHTLVSSTEIAFSGNNKMKSKTEGSVSFALLDVETCKEDETTTDKEEDYKTPATKSEEIGVTSKSKKKKKNKSGKTKHEEDDDFDKILAEFGVTPVSSASEVEKIQGEPEPVSTGEKDGEEETVESAAAKKKKKKKNAATSSVEANEDTQENSISEPSQRKKKEPKHVLEIREKLARLKEAEERKKKEEEEKLRKAEEERRLQEEQEREAEEIRRKRRIREKEKLQKKKQEGLILTAKQKKDQAFKKKLLADAGGLPDADKNSDSSKRPVYTNKKKSAREKTNNSASVEKKEIDAPEGAALHEMVSADDERIDITESADTEEKQGAADVAHENSDEWDAKSQDSYNLNIKGDFDDEEEDTQLVVKKDTTLKAHCSGQESILGFETSPMIDRPTVKAKPATAAKEAMPKVDKSSGLNEVVKEREENLRSPICCIMGHVDTGKTKLLDCIRGTNVQEGEAGGITQQIGATYFPAENIRERTKDLKADAKLKVPGLLVIDTPGHESFRNLRSRGSSLCDIAILVVDIMHGLEPQTIESLNLLRRRNTEFIVALNKVDRLYGWTTCKNAPIRKAMKQQSKDVINEFNMRLTGIITQFKEQGLNTEVYYKNREMGETFSIVPTSAISGEGIPDLLLLLVQWAQRTMVEKLTYVDKVQCTVLEVEAIEGHGTTIDVVLVNGVLHQGDQIVVCGSQGPIVTSIRSLLTPLPMKEIRVKGEYRHHKQVKAAQCIKITAQGLEHAVAGTALHVIGPDEDVEEAKNLAMEDMESVMSLINKSGEGVYVQSSSLGSLEALLEFLKSPEVEIPVSGIGIGPVHKKDIMKAGVMLEKKKEYATILAFDVKVTAEAQEIADQTGVKIMRADIIYHLFDEFQSYMEDIKEEKKKETASDVVFPCVLKILPNGVFRKRDPIILGVDVMDGILKVGTPICIPKRVENLRVFMDIGRVESIEMNKKPVEYAKKGQKNVAIKIIASNSGEQKMFGRHFGMEDKLVSHISRQSMDILRTNYSDELSEDDWDLVLRLQRLFKIQ